MNRLNPASVGTHYRNRHRDQHQNGERQRIVAPVKVEVGAAPD
jgi:hypothetical protein